ncbi:MAG: plasmid pRiA4b ORF-3 family protein, partial [Vicinamibacterales bacterium]
ELQSVEPLIWRVLRVPADLRLSELHRALQTVMGWLDQHPHQFEIAKRVFAPHDRTTASDAGWHCSSEDLTIVEALAAGRDGITYIYDRGPEWRLRITRAPGAWRPASKSAIVCLDGYLAGPLDDSGGPAAYNAILAATLGRGPRLSRAVLARLGPNFDPERFDRSAINRELAHLRGAPVQPE